MTKKFMWCCVHCGGTNVYSDAYVGLNDSEDVMIFDTEFCADCEDHDASTEQREVEVEVEI